MSGGALPVSLSLVAFYLVLIYCAVYFFYTMFSGIGLILFLVALGTCIYLLR